MQRTLLFVTTNQGKLREAREVLGVDIESLDLKVDEVQTLDPIECTQKKAEAAYAKVKKPLFVEDVALFFDAWNGLPGVFIDYFMKTLDNRGIIKLLKGEKNRTAKAQTTLCYFDGKDKITAVGVTEGTISLTPKGKNGFGWDPIFIPKGFTKTYAQLSDQEKNKVSMRRIALLKLRKML